MSGQCEATVASPKSPNLGQRCRRSAVNGATACAAHGGLQTTTTPDKVRKKLDQPGQPCTATKSDGEPCGNYAIKGGFVCVTHGGNLDNVREAARKRLLSLVAPAISAVEDILSDKATSASDRLRASNMVLNRTGFSEKTEVTLEAKPWEQLVKSAGILRELDDISDAEVVEDDDPFGFDRLLDPVPDDEPPAKETLPEQEKVTSRAQPPSYVRR